MEIQETYTANGNTAETPADLNEVVFRQEQTIGLLQESVRELEVALFNSDWRMLTVQAQQEFTREGLRLITELARIMHLKNPVIKRGVDIQRLYVWAQGMSIRAKQPEINDVVQAFLDDERNQAELTSHQERGEKEKDLQLEANLFFCFFTNTQNGRVRVRTIPLDEIYEIICNPEDRKEPWFYKRVWVETGIDGNQAQKTALYPDWQYKPTNKPPSITGLPVNWDKPVYHVAVNKYGRFGVSEVYASLDWARAYKSFLENLASVWQALARWAAKLTVKGGAAGVAAAKTKLNTTLSTTQGETNPSPISGSTFIQAEGRDLQPFRTAGATMSAEDGRRLFLMAAAPLGFPETFYGDTSVGTLATAESLDRPTELKIKDRQTLWADIHRAIMRFVVLQAVKAPMGDLHGLGRVIKEIDGEQYTECVVFGEDVDPTIDIQFPSIVASDIQKQIGALKTATTLDGQAPAGTFDLKTFTRLAAIELGIPDVDALIDQLFPEGEETAEPTEPTPTAESMMVEAVKELREAIAKGKKTK